MARDETGGAEDDGAPESRAAQAGKFAIWRFAPFLLFAAIGVFFGIQLASPPDGTLRSQLISRPAPDFSLPVLGGAEGATFTQAALAQGDVTIVNFWASWCAPCRIEHPHLMTLGEREDIRVLGIAYHDKPADSQRFLDELGDPFALVGLDESGQTALRWGVEGVPETFVVNGAGEVIYKHSGPIDVQDMANTILPAIAAAKGG